MLQGKEIWSCVFARAGSKGVPKKNLRKINGISLIERAVLKAKSAPAIDKVFVSTDCDDIINMAKSAGAEVLFKRPRNLASDTSPEILSWKHLIGCWHERYQTLPDLFVSVPTVCPLVDPNDLEQTIRCHLNSSSDITITATQDHSKSAFLSGIENDQGFSFLSENKFFQRQEGPDIFKLVAGCYVTTPGYIESVDSIKEGKIGISEISQEKAVDIDTEFDFLVAKLLLENSESWLWEHLNV
ncbi:hypothetical protein AB3X55_00090 [Alphaproteobacteria bacterium LSUCC0719]